LALCLGDHLLSRRDRLVRGVDRVLLGLRGGRRVLDQAGGLGDDRVGLLGSGQGVTVVLGGEAARRGGGHTLLVQVHQGVVPGCQRGVDVGLRRRGGGRRRPLRAGGRPRSGGAGRAALDGRGGLLRAGGGGGLAARGGGGALTCCRPADRRRGRGVGRRPWRGR